MTDETNANADEQQSQTRNSWETTTTQQQPKDQKKTPLLYQNQPTNLTNQEKAERAK